MGEILNWAHDVEDIVGDMVYCITENKIVIRHGDCLSCTNEKCEYTVNGYWVWSRGRKIRRYPGWRRKIVRDLISNITFGVEIFILKHSLRLYGLIYERGQDEVFDY